MTLCAVSVRSCPCVTGSGETPSEPMIGPAAGGMATEKTAEWSTPSPNALPAASRTVDVPRIVRRYVSSVRSPVTGMTAVLVAEVYETAPRSAGRSTSFALSKTPSPPEDSSV